MKEYNAILVTGKNTGKVNDEIDNLTKNGWRKSYDLFIVMEREIPETPSPSQKTPSPTAITQGDPS